MSGDSKLNRQEYEALLKPLGKELVSLSRWVGEMGQRVVVIFEGRDTAGKGGSIDMFARVLASAGPQPC